MENTLPIIFCTCPKLKCPRRGNCGPCRAYHLKRKKPQPPRCERKPGLLQRLWTLR